MKPRKAGRHRAETPSVPPRRRRGLSLPFLRGKKRGVVVETRGPNRIEAAAWFGLALAILAWPRPAYGPPPAKVPRPPLPFWRRLFSSGLGFDYTEHEVAAAASREPGRGREAKRPSQIPKQGWKDILWRTWQEYNNDRVPAVAGSVAFFSLLALFPALAAFVSLYGLFSDVQTAREQLNIMAGLLPPDALQFVGDNMLRIASTHESGLGFAFALSLLLSIWSANAGMKALFDGLNIAYEEKEKRGFFRLNLVALACTAGGIVFVVTVLSIVVALPVALSILGYAGRDPMWMLRWPLLLGGMILVLAALYRYGPSRALARWQWVTWGSVAAALLWVFASMAFSWYVANFGAYDRTYGSLGAAVGFLTWIWLSIQVVLLGAELNAEIEHQTAVDSTTGPPEPLGHRQAKMADTIGKTSERLKAEPPKPETPPMSGDKLGPKK